MITVSNIALSLDALLPGNEALMRKEVAKALHIPLETMRTITLTRKSVDARKKSHVHFAVSCAVELTDKQVEKQVLDTEKLPHGVHVSPYQAYKPLIPPYIGPRKLRPVVVGAGPAGLFAALYLAKAGLRPLLVEQGGPVDDRLRAVNSFNNGGPLDVHTNIQFGEGGAGTFSDGKLTTNTKSPWTRHVLQWFYEAGAPQEILIDAKPHMGTDKLAHVVRHLREAIIEAGGEVRFYTQLVDLDFSDGRLSGVLVKNTQTEKYTHEATDTLILACGHSARSTFQLMLDAGLKLEQKPFAVGVRIEHLQEAINYAQYGKAYKHPALGAADYKLVVHLDNGRSVYTFCMCPGGEVVCATSEEDAVVVNGMSNFNRDGINANSALLVGVGPQDFESNNPLAGMNLQRRMEEAAFKLAIDEGGKPYQAPAQLVGDFLDEHSSTEAGQVIPTYARGVVYTNLESCLPPFVSSSIRKALPLLDKKLHGFAADDAVLTGVETRSSSPVRIVRNENFQAVMDQALPDGLETGIFPCGEGPGYAGGIMSAA
ncbi:MAG: NAD(P)/FAD-dependent oxidoreductase, partial [Eggerthellaceae bacterium]